MLFNSLPFLAFLAVVLPLYFGVPARYRWSLLLVASAVFYMAFVPAYIALLLPLVAGSFWLALQIERAVGRRRQALLALGVAATCLLLVAFKYAGFFASVVTRLRGAAGSSGGFEIEVLLFPIGLSFQTFQVLSYLVEVYRGRQVAERHPGIYSLHILFFPKLVAGPIERPQNLLPQLHALRGFERGDFVSGLGCVAWGYFKKMVVADRLAGYVNSAYSDWHAQTGLTLLVATLMFAVQIYADFSGYSAIAVGLARMMGIRLARNFHHPYFAAGAADFWHRWHISLSTWFRDYVYIPLGRNWKFPGRHYASVLVTFVLSGLWHGAGWTYLAWGAYHGLLVAGETALNSRRVFHVRWAAVLRRVVALPLLIAGWVLFRAESMPAAMEIYRKIATGIQLDGPGVSAAVLLVTGDNSAAAVMLTTLFFVVAMFAAEFVFETDARGWATQFARSRRLQVMAALATCQCVLFFGVLQPSAFIYRQF